MVQFTCKPAGAEMSKFSFTVENIKVHIWCKELEKVEVEFPPIVAGGGADWASKPGGCGGGGIRKELEKDKADPDPCSRKCSTCKYGYFYAMDLPCRICDIKDNNMWEFKPETDKPFIDTEWTDALLEIYQEAKADGRDAISFAEVDERLKSKAKPSEVLI